MADDGGAGFVGERADDDGAVFFEPVVAVGGFAFCGVFAGGGEPALVDPGGALRRIRRRASHGASNDAACTTGSRAHHAAAPITYRQRVRPEPTGRHFGFAGVGDGAGVLACATYV